MAVIVLTTVANETEGKALARDLIERRLAACVNVLPGACSIYRWKGQIAEEGEAVLVIKTAPDRLDPLRERIATHHPYELPELLVFPAAGGSADYLAWIKEMTRPSETEDR